MLCSVFYGVKNTERNERVAEASKVKKVAAQKY